MECWPLDYPRSHKNHKILISSGAIFMGKHVIAYLTPTRRGSSQAGKRETETRCKEVNRPVGTCSDEAVPGKVGFRSWTDSSCPHLSPHCFQSTRGRACAPLPHAGRDKSECVLPPPAPPMQVETDRRTGLCFASKAIFCLHHPRLLPLCHLLPAGPSKSVLIPVSSIFHCSSIT